MYDDEGDGTARSSFGTYLAEGDKLYNAAEYVKALESYSIVSSKLKISGFILDFFNRPSLPDLYFTSMKT